MIALSRDALVLLVVYVFAVTYAITVFSWFAARQSLPPTDQPAPGSERFGLAAILGVLLVAVLNNLFSGLIGAKGTAALLVLLPIGNMLVLARRRSYRSQLFKELRAVLPRAAVSAAVCGCFVLACLHKLFLFESLSSAGIFYPDLSFHVGRVVEQAFQSQPGFWPLSPIAFPAQMPFQSFVADSLASATFRYLALPLHAFTYAQVLFAWAMVLWTAVILIGASSAVTGLIALVTAILLVPFVVWRFQFGSVLHVLFHANPNSLIASPLGLALTFHLYRSFARQSLPFAAALVIIPPASLFYKVNLAPAFVFLQAIGLVIGSRQRPRESVRRALMSAGAWAIAIGIGIAGLIGRAPIPLIIRPLTTNFWAYVDVAIPTLRGLHAPFLLLRYASALILFVAGSWTCANLRTRQAASPSERPPLGVATPALILVTGMAYVGLVWLTIVPKPAFAQGEPVHVNFELVVWLTTVPIALSLCRMYKAGPGAAAAALTGGILTLAVFLAWRLNTQIPENGGLPLHADYSFATELRLRDALSHFIPGGHCFAYDRRYVIYANNQGEFPADFVMAASGCPVLNGRRFRGILGQNESQDLRELPAITIGSARYQVIDMDPCTQPPSAPFDFTAEVQGTLATLTWNEKDSASAYLIELGSKTGLKDLGLWTVGNGERQRTVEDARSGIYFVRVRARNRCGLSEPSQEIRAVVP